MLLILHLFWYCSEGGHGHFINNILDADRGVDFFMC